MMILLAMIQHKYTQTCHGHSDHRQKSQFPTWRHIYYCQVLKTEKMSAWLHSIEQGGQHKSRSDMKNWEGHSYWLHPSQRRLK